MNSMQWSTNCLISRDMSEYSPFNTDSVDFNTDLNFSQVLSEITDLDSLHTQIFNMQCEELNEKKIWSSRKDIGDACKYKSDIDNYDLEINSSTKALPVVTDELMCHEKQSNSDIDSRPCNAIEEELDSIFKPKKNKSNSLASRRDVINKVILRGFKRFFVTLLNSKAHKSGFSIDSKISEKTEILANAHQLGLLELKEEDVSHQQFEELISWLGFAKLTKKVMSLFSNDILTKYSHQKMIQVLKNKQIKILLRYFIVNNQEDFLNSLKLNRDLSLSINAIDENDSCILESYKQAFQDLIDQLSPL